MIKIISALILGTLCMLPTYSQKEDPKSKDETRQVYVIKKATQDKLMTAESAIKAACMYAKITDYTIDKELVEEPGKMVSQISGKSLEVLFLKVCSTFDIEFTKTTYEDGSSLFQFKKAKKK